jgi:hypothetical protein
MWCVLMTELVMKYSIFRSVISIKMQNFSYIIYEADMTNEL